MTLAELINETLVEKHSRLMQAKCKHEEIFCANLYGPDMVIRDKICMDCGKLWQITTAVVDETRKEN